MLKKKFPKIVLDPPFDLETDFKAMDTDPPFGAVSYDEFDSWWRERTGDDAPDIPVLPESMVRKINELASVQSRLPGLDKADPGKAYTGVQLWDFLRPRLRNVVELQKLWGNLHNMYPTASATSIFEDKPIPHMIRDPDSEMATYWDLAQVLLLLYVSFTVPFRTSMDITINPDAAEFWIDVLVDIYFITDMVFGFTTAYWTTNGILETESHAIRRNYLSGWFTIDLLSCLPVTYISLIASAIEGRSNEGSQSARIFKTLRLLRLAKLLRIARLKKLMSKYEDLFDANQYMGLVLTLFVILFAAHMMACSWYALGKSEAIGPSGEVVFGWVQNADGANWSKEMLEKGCGTAEGCAISHGRRYITAMFTSFDLSYAFLNSEYGFLLVSILITGFIYGALAGVISTLLMGLAAGDQDYTAKLQALKAWMGARGLRKADRTKILAYYKAANKGAKAFNEAEILAELPPALGGDIALFLYGDILKGLPIFRGLGDECMTALCRVVHPMTALRGQLVTEEDKVGTELYFIVDGEVEVIQEDERLGFLGVGSFFGENPVLEAIEGKGGGGSTVRMRTIRATGPCDLGFLRLDEILAVMDSFPELRIRVQQFRNKGLKLSKKGKKFMEMKAALQSHGDDQTPDDTSEVDSVEGIAQTLRQRHTKRSEELEQILANARQTIVDVVKLKQALTYDSSMLEQALTVIGTGG